MAPMTLTDFALAVTRYRRAMDASITSWGRSTAHNLRVGGVIDSYHLADLAVDLVYDALPPHARAVALAAELGLFLIRETTHDHLQPLEQGEPPNAHP